MKRLLAVLVVAGAIAVPTALTQAEETPVAVTPETPTCAKFTAKDHNRLIDKSIIEKNRLISKGKFAKHDAMVECAVPGAAGEMERDWNKAVDKHRAYVHRVLAYPGGENPVGGHKWALPYCIVVGESGAGSGSSNLYGMLEGWAYAPSWANGSASSASFWAQSVAAYNLRQHGFGGWSTWPC